MSLSAAAHLRIESLAVGDPAQSEARALVAHWEVRFPGDCPVQAGLIEQAVTALVDLGRCRRVRAALLADKVRTALLRWQNEQEDRILLCLRTLNLEPYQGMADFTRFAAGVRHIIGRWVRIEEALARDKTLYGNMMLEAIQMQGCSARVSELHFCEEAYLTWVHCLRSQPAPSDQEEEMLWASDVMPVSIQCNPPQPWPPPREYCQEQLQNLVGRELLRLRTLERKLRFEVEEPARAAAIELALAQTTHDEIALLRAERHHEGSYQAACKALLKLPAPRRAVAEVRLIAQAVPPEPPRPRPPAAPRTATSQSWTAGPRVRETHRPSQGRTVDDHGMLRIANDFLETTSLKAGEKPLMPLSQAAQERITAFAFSAEARDDAQGLIDTWNVCLPDPDPATAGLIEQALVAQVSSWSRTSSDTPEPQTNPEPQAPLVTIIDPEEWERYQDCLKELPPSPARSQAARINGAKGVGPVSEASKMASRLGRLTHRMASKLNILPGESEEELNALINTYKVDYDVRDDAGSDLAEVAANALWKARRCGDSDAAATTKSMCAIVDRHEDRKSTEVEALIPMLLTNAPEAVRQLRNSNQGLAYLLGQVTILEARLVKHRTFEPSQRLLAIRIAGYDPRTILTCPAVTEINLAYLSGLHGRGGTDAAEAAAMFQDEKPESLSMGEFERRLGLAMEVGMETIAAGHATLKRLMADLRQSLKDRQELVDLRQARDIELDFRAAKVATDHDGVLRTRYLTGHLRLYLSAVRQLQGLQRSRQKEQGDEGGGGAPKAARKQSGSRLRTEPKGSEPARPADPAPAVGKTGVGDAVAGAPGVAPGSSG